MLKVTVWLPPAYMGWAAGEVDPEENQAVTLPSVLFLCC